MGSIASTVHQLFWTLAPKSFLSIENGLFFPPTKSGQMMTFVNPLDALIPDIPFSFFAESWVRVISGARGSVSVGFWGVCVCQLSPLWGEGASQRAVSPRTPPPPSRDS